jgi:putative oxidoreductase
MMLKKFEPQTYALLRIVAGVMFAMHGSMKLLGWPAMPNGGGGGGLPPMMMVAGVIELVGGVMIAIGLLTSIAAFIASGEMAGAFFIGHAPHGLNPLTNQGELAVLYCFLFLFMAARGSGIWSVDSMRGARTV